MEYADLVREVFSDEKLKRFVVSGLRHSMADIGFSQELIDEFLGNIDILDLPAFIDTHKDELSRVQLGHFLDELAPKYFSETVLPEIPSGGKVLDVGCGRGTLVRSLIARGTNDAVVGIDINAAPEWEALLAGGARLVVVQEGEFLSFLEQEQPDAIVVTWVFHHMEFGQQKRYLESLHSVLKKGASLVVLEDAYAERLPPEAGSGRHEAFMELSVDERRKVMGAYDWIANRVFSMRTTMPVPFAYRTVEEWKALFEETGFSVTKTRFLGFPEQRDVPTPQSVLVAVR